MRLLFLLLCLSSIVELTGQSMVKDFKIFEPEVSRKEIKTLDGVVRISRKSKDPNKSNGDIRLTKTGKNGKVIWDKYFGGSGYEYVGSFLQTKEKGFLIIGTTSSFGNGNNNIYLVKADNEGNEVWSKTYGGFFNEYGYYIKEEMDGSITIKGKKQFCKSENVGSGCLDKIWIINTNANGEILSERILEPKAI